LPARRCPETPAQGVVAYCNRIEYLHTSRSGMPTRAPPCTNRSVVVRSFAQFQAPMFLPIGQMGIVRQLSTQPHSNTDHMPFPMLPGGAV